jgi:uracil-DNA glycosylase
VWTVLKDYDKLPIIWNAFPFHPHQPNDVKSNRTPIPQELNEGRLYLSMVIELFSKPQLIALGDKSFASLIAMGYEDSHKIIHPSCRGKGMIGKRPFQSQLLSIIDNGS